MMRVAVTVESGRLELDKGQVRRVLRAAGNEIAGATRSLIRGAAGGGRRYFLNRGASYQASAPGQPPVSRTGQLADSIAVRVFRNGEGVRVTEGVHYALFLAVGARGGAGSGKAGVRGQRNRRGGVAGSRVLEARPSLTTVLEQRQALIEARIRIAINTGMKFQRMRK